MFTRDQIADALRFRYSTVQQTGDWRPLAQYVVDVVELAVAEEREACAAIAQMLLGYTGEPVEYIPGVSKEVVDAIRARGKP